MGYLARSLKAASQARRYVCEGLSSCTHSDSLPLWHSAVFQKGNQLTYYCPSLMKRGVLTVGDLFDCTGAPTPRLLGSIGDTWQAVYCQGLQWVQGMLPSDWSIPSVWLGSWGKSDMLKLLAREPYTEHMSTVPTSPERFCLSVSLA